MSNTKMRVRVGLGIVALALLGGCSCYPNIKSVEPQYDPDKAEAAEAQARVHLVTDGLSIVAVRDES